MAERASFFISYRRDDSAGHVGRLYDTLAARFGAAQIFVDIDHIGPGEDFVRVLDGAVAKSLVMLVVIGKRWLVDESGYSRLQNPGDWVRLEVVAGLQRGMRVIPVLVQGASMPNARDLPHDLRDLTTRNAFELSDLRWRDDVQRLIAELDRIVTAAHKEAVAAARAKASADARVHASEHDGDARSGKGIRWSWIAAAAVLVLIAGFYYRGKSAQSGDTGGSSSQVASAEPPSVPANVADNGASAKDDARRWRRDAKLYAVSLQQSTQQNGSVAFSVGYAFVSPADRHIMNIVDGPSGRGFYPVSQYFSGAIYPIATPFMDLSEALAAAKREGMSSPLARASLYWHTPANRPAVLVWTLVPTDQSRAAAYNINANTGELVPIPQLLD